jgi:hypothetical protein
MNLDKFKQEFQRLKNKGFVPSLECLAKIVRLMKLARLIPQ